MKILTAFVFVFTTTFTFFNNGESTQTFEMTESIEMDCPFTYEQGLNVGCTLARQANRHGCETDCYALFAETTYNQYRNSCPEYARGVRDGFFECFVDPVWTNNLGGNVPSDDEVGEPCYWDETTYSIVCP